MVFMGLKLSDIDFLTIKKKPGMINTQYIPSSLSKKGGNFYYKQIFIGFFIINKSSLLSFGVCFHVFLVGPQHN